jgi:hypothetical protein
MNVRKVDGMYKSSRITGPYHNFLGLRFSPTEPVQIAFIPQPFVGETPVIDVTCLETAVLSGVRDGWAETREPLFVSEIEYVPSDTAIYSAYHILAKAIAEVASRDDA